MVDYIKQATSLALKQEIAAIVTATAMAIFSGDIPGVLLRIPGTPASAASWSRLSSVAQCEVPKAMTPMRSA